MKSRNPFLSTLLATFAFLLLCSVGARSQEMHPHKHDTSEKLGDVNFSTTCSPEVQRDFNRATAMLHSFWYDEAEKAYTAIAKADPKCAMAYWGVAMSLYHPVWAPATPAELQKGLAAIEKAKAIGATTQREKDYIAAIEVYFRDYDKLDHRTRALAYEQAMERVHMNNPKDREGAIFYALALLGTALQTDKTYANQKRAAGILNKILPLEPQHPGVAHYLIHSFDYPELAELALPAARSYSKIAASSPHALHMPSHIFTRLGLWDESIQSNLASAKAARDHVAKTHAGSSAFEELHALDYLVYAYLQRAQDEKAKKLLDQVNKVNKVDAEVLAAAFAFGAIPARYTLERRRWSDAAALELRPASFPWERFRFVEAIVYFARAVGAARTGNVEAARADVEKLEKIHAGMAGSKDPYWPGQVEIDKLAAAAWLAHAEGKNDEALRLMREAVKVEDSTEKHAVTPGPIIPAREQLGEMLLELKKPAEALREFEASLKTSPNRFNGLYGAARAAELAGDRKLAGSYYAKLVTLTKDADTNRAELQQAKDFVAKH